MIYDIIIIGAGAAGLFAASNIKLSNEQHGLIINKASRPGLKLLMSGGGQCNLTHSGNIRDYITHYGNNGKKIRSVLYSFSNSETYDWFTSRGIPLVTRSDGKIFPKSMNSKDILDLLLQTSASNNFQLLNNTSVTSILPASYEHSENRHLHNNINNTTLSPDGCNIFTIQTKTTTSNDEDKIKTYKCYKLLIATGGASYPTTGSDGSIFSILENLNIDIEEIHPSLVPLSTENYPYSTLSGNTVRQASITVYNGTQRKKNSPVIIDDILFTHKNFSGPAILNISRYIRPGMTLEINWLPSISPETIYSDLNASKNRCKKKTISVFNEYFSKYDISDAITRLLLTRAKISHDLKFSDITKKDLKKFINILTSDRFIISGTSGYRQAMATAGGVRLSDIDLNTMQSKKYNGLYFAGEVTDIDGDTGGYNLQYAFASAYRAITSIKNSI